MTGIERCRRWSDAEKRSALAGVGVNGARVADVAWRHDLTRQHIYQWRGAFRRRGESLAEETGFLPVEIAPAPNVTSAPTTTATVEIVLANCRRLRGIEGRSPSAMNVNKPWTICPAWVYRWDYRQNDPSLPVWVSQAGADSMPNG